jgi:hypothetical protein
LKGANKLLTINQVVLQCLFYALEQAYSSSIEITTHGVGFDTDACFSQLKQIALAISTAMLFWSPSKEELEQCWWYDPALLDKVQAAKDFYQLYS